LWLGFHQINHAQTSMNRRLRPGEAIGGGIHRILAGELDVALRWLRRRGAEAQGASIHETRRQIKSIRAVLRLLRPVLGDTRYRWANDRFRCAGRLLGRQRDRHVLRIVAGSLSRRLRGEPAGGAFALLGRVLNQETEETTAGEIASREEVEALLREARARIDKWPIERIDRRDLRRGLRASYRRGRRAFRNVRIKPSDENLHEWRKRAKDLWYQLRLVRAICNKRAGRSAKRVRRLGEYLGEDHDLMLVSSVATNALTGSDRDLCASWIHARRGRLGQRALADGRKLFSERPGKFARRLGLPGDQSGRRGSR
jgi:CHAD domain-containing protein